MIRVSFFAVVHTQPEGVSKQLITHLEQEMTARPVLSTVSHGTDMGIAGPDDVSASELDEEFERLDKAIDKELAPNMESNTNQPTHLQHSSVVCEVDQVYNLVELEQALEGTIPVFAAEDRQLHHGLGEGAVS